MYVGIPNPNAMMPLEKMVIENLDTGSEITVLYNPQSYTQQKTVNFKPIPFVGSEAPLLQFRTGNPEILSFELFFDSLYAGSEVGGDFGDGLKFAANSIVSSADSFIDIRDYTKQVYTLAKIEPSVHRVPRLLVSWASLQFQCYLQSVSQRFTKFNESGTPIRAIVKCSFIQDIDQDKMFGSSPPESPDTTKYHRVEAGDSLWSLAVAEYGDAGAWRAIADANGLSNPRLLRTGDMLRIPALVK